jgi:hypothetical protein
MFRFGARRLFWHYKSTNVLFEAKAKPRACADTRRGSRLGEKGTGGASQNILHPRSAVSAREGTDGRIIAPLPDTDAPEGGTEGWNTPRLSTRLSDTETIALLAAQRGKNGKHRYLANQIHGLVGGARADVLAQVRAVRDGAPTVFRPLTDEQQLRQQLQLGER